MLLTITRPTQQLYATAWLQSLTAISYCRGNEFLREDVPRDRQPEWFCHVAGARDTELAQRRLLPLGPNVGLFVLSERGRGWRQQSSYWPTPFERDCPTCRTQRG